MESETPQNDNRLVYVAFKSESVEPDSLWLSARGHVGSTARSSGSEEQ